MNNGLPKGFFAYPSAPPAIGETIQTAIENLNKTAGVTIQGWEKCSVSGKVIIEEICRVIDDANLFCADLTGLNPNVMFELGFAIGRNKRVWLITDTSFAAFKNDFDQLRILTTIGYVSYQNSQNIIAGYHKDVPHADLTNTIFKNSIEPNLSLSDNTQLLYLKNRFNTDASIKISNRINELKLPTVIDDPQESTVQSLTWYGTQIYKSNGIVCHFTHPDREGARLHNARYALVAGIAHGMGKPLLMLTEGQFLAPIDYREMLKHYQRAAEASQYLEEWLSPIELTWKKEVAIQREYDTSFKLANELKGLQVGEYVAENESARLVDEYFVDTTYYEEAFNGNTTIFVGRKGAGKSANLLALTSRLKADPRNLVCVIKPVAYELQGIIRLLDRYSGLDQRGYAIESLWKFLLYSEIARTATELIESRAYLPKSEAEQKLLDLMDRDGGLLREDFSVRLERSVERVLEQKLDQSDEKSSTQRVRIAISEALHDGLLSEIRQTLADVLSDKKRVAVLIDNLDKAWDKQSNLAQLSQFLLGLLSLSDRFTSELRSGNARRGSINGTVAVFLRSDIFNRVLDFAREPDKIAHTKIRWNDAELLMRVIEERFMSSRRGKGDPSELWRKYFCKHVKGMPTKSYLLDRILPRPRDLVFLVKSSIANAVNRGHISVQENDILEAEKQYSQYALESILVENGDGIEALEDVIYEFIGSPSLLVQEEVRANLLKTVSDESQINEYISLLCRLSFLGVEVGENNFRFVDDPEELRRNETLARKFVERNGGVQRYMINKPFWAFLEILAA